MLFWRTILPLPSNHCFAIYQKSDFNRSKSHLNSFTFHGVFLLTQDHIFCSDSYRGSVKFYRDTTQILWLLASAHSGDKWWLVTKSLALYFAPLHVHDVERNDKDASKPVARHFNLPNHSKQHMAVCGLSLHLGSSESRKTLEQKFIFQIGTLNPHGINERFSFN